MQAVDFENYENVLQSLTVLNGLVASLCIATALAIYNLHKSFRFLLPLTLSTIVFNNWWVGNTGFDFSLNETTLASLIFAGLGCILLEKNSFKLLRNPKLKWWNVPARKKTAMPVSLSKLRGGFLEKKAFDISESGMFIPMQEGDDFKNYQVGERIELNLHFNLILKVRCEARIVRMSPRHGNYPTGLGLQFIDMNRVDKSIIKKLIGEMEAEA